MPLDVWMLGILRRQQWLPLNPEHFANVPAKPGAEHRHQLSPYVAVHTLEGAKQVIALGSYASQEVIKEPDRPAFIHTNSE